VPNTITRSVTEGYETFDTQTLPGEYRSHETPVRVSVPAIPASEMGFSAPADLASGFVLVTTVSSATFT
jgi:hypothetical protein